MAVREVIRKLFRPDSPTYVNYSNGTAGTTGSYTVSPAEAALRGGAPKKNKKSKK